MNLRCMYCQTMFGISHEAMLISLQTMEAESLSHYDFHCPKCRRANRVERVKLERANPNWQEAVKAIPLRGTLAAETASAEKEATPAKKDPKLAAPKKAKTGTEKKPAAKGKTK